MNWIKRVTSRGARAVANDVLGRIPEEFDLVPDAPPAPVAPAPKIAQPEPTPEPSPASPTPWFQRLVDLYNRKREEARAMDSTPLAKVKRSVLRVAAISSAIACSVVSGYFLYKYFSDTQPPIIAAVMSVTVAVVIVASPEFAVSLARKGKFISAIVVLAVFVFAMGYSMSSTIARVYNARTEKLVVIQDETGQEDAEIQSAAVNSSILETRLSRYSSELETQRETVGSYASQIDTRLQSGEDPNSKAMVSLVANRNKAQSEIVRLEKEIKAAEDALMSGSTQASLAKGKVDRADFVSWMAGVLGIQRDTLELALASFPAIFNDVIAPVMLVIAFAL